MDSSILFSLIILFPSIFFLLLIKSGKLYNRTHNNLPPGPSLLPFFAGSIFSGSALPRQLATQPHRALTELAALHGPLMTLQTGSITSIVVSSAAVAKHVLLTTTTNFSSQFVLDAVYAHHHQDYSAAWLPTSSPQWRALRRFYAGHLMNPRRLDASAALRRGKVAYLLDVVGRHARDGAAFDVACMAQMTFFEIMVSAYFGRDGDLGERKMREMKEAMIGILKETGTTNVVDLFPMLHSVDPQRIRHRLTVLTKKLFSVLDEIIESRLKRRAQEASTSSTTSSPSSDGDVLDSLLDLLESQKDGINRDFVPHTMLDSLGAGMDATSKTVEWGLSELINHPNVLKNAQAEIDTIVGKGNLVEESHISKLPYFQAVLKETFRMHPPAPFLLPRKVEEDVEVFGYTIPKGSRLLVNIWAIARDPDKWDNPNVFSPERFLNVNIDVKGQHLDLIPFGAGRRICPGMPISLRAISMILASFISCFDWKVEDGHAKELDMQEEMVITLKKVNELRAIPVRRA